MMKAGAISLKAVVPGLPKNAKDRELLEEDLRRIRCHGLLGKPWGLRMEEMVAEIIGEKDNRWDGTVRQAPEKWTAKEWRKVYSFERGGEGMASQTDRFIDGMFSGKVNPKDGYAVADCRDPRVRRLLEFLVLLLYPEKPTRVTITVGNTIFGALSGERPVDWGVVVKDVVQRLLSGMGKSKATPICPYIFHLYHAHELLLTNEKKEYRIQEALVKHNVESDEDDDPASPANPDEKESSDDSECESLTPSEIREIQKQEAARLKKSPANRRKQPPVPKDPATSKRKSPGLGDAVDAVERNYQTIAFVCREIWAKEREREALIQEVCQQLGNVRPEKLLEAIEHLPSQKRMEKLEAKVSFLQEKNKKANEDLKEEKEVHRKAVDKLNLSLAFNQKLEAYVGNAGDVINKAQLFDANLAQHPVTAKKVIPVLVDFADKMEELLDNMRVLFDGLLPEVPPIAVENLPEILGEVPSLTGWGKDGTTKTPTKPGQTEPSEPRQEEIASARPEPLHSPRTRLEEESAPTREVLVEFGVSEVIRELEEEEGASLTPTPPARIDVVQTGPEEQMTERMRELPTPPSGPTSEPISLSTPISLVRSSFLQQLETVVKTPFRPPGQGPIFRLPISSPTPASIGTDTQDTPEVSGSMRSVDKGTETTSLASRMTRFVAKQTPGSSPRPKRAYVSSSKGSSSKRWR